MLEFDFDDPSVWGMEENSASSSNPGKSIGDLSGDAAAWFVQRAAAKGISAAVETPEVVHEEYCVYAERDLCASARDLLTDLLSEVQYLLDLEDSPEDGEGLADHVRVLANSSRTAVSGKVAVKIDRPRGEYGSGSISFKIDGALKQALMAVAPAAQKREKA